MAQSRLPADQVDVIPVSLMGHRWLEELGMTVSATVVMAIVFWPTRVQCDLEFSAA